MKKGAKVFLVKYEHQADYKVFFVDYANREKNAELIANCEIVKYEHQADYKLFLVKYEHQADIKIMRKNFPHGA